MKKINKIMVTVFGFLLMAILVFATSLNLEIPKDVYDKLSASASSSGTTPEQKATGYIENGISEETKAEYTATRNTYVETISKALNDKTKMETIMNCECVIRALKVVNTNATG